MTFKYHLIYTAKQDVVELNESDSQMTVHIMEWSTLPSLLNCDVTGCRHVELTVLQSRQHCNWFCDRWHEACHRLCRCVIVFVCHHH